MNKNRNSNVLFIIVIAISVAFILIPLTLRIGWIHCIVSCFLSPLGEYVSSYIETLGAILGTFLAITGALWTQRKIDEAQDKKELRESALIVYYDFKFAFSDIIRFMNCYSTRQQKVCNTLEDFEQFKKIKEISHMYIYIDDNWIHNVAKLSCSLSSNEIQQIYKMYGDLCTIKRVFNSSINEMSQDDAQSAYSIMFNDLCRITGTLTTPINIDVALEEKVQLIMDRLGELSGVEENS